MIYRSQNREGIILDYVTVNQSLRKLIQELVDIGYKKTIIGKLLLGQSGYVPMLDFLEKDDRSFGIKPLTRLADILDSELHIVFVEKTEENYDNIVNSVNSINDKFFNSLKDNVVAMLNDMRIENNSDKYHVKKKKKSDIEAILNEFLELEEDNGPKLE